MWVCLNCEAENDPTREHCNVCDALRAARDTPSAHKTKNSRAASPASIARTDWPPASRISDNPAVRAWAFGAIAFVCLMVTLVLASPPQKQGNQAESQNLARTEEQQFRAASGDLDRLRAYTGNCRVCAFKPEALNAISSLEYEGTKRREESSYREASGSKSKLHAYVSTCQICTFKSNALNEIANLERRELTQREEKTYRAAKGNIGSLRSYIQDCQVCAFASAAHAEIRELEDEEERRNPRVTFQIKSNHPNVVELSFYSDRNRVWPGSGQTFKLPDYETHTFPLNCQVGETICYGAWVTGGKLTPYWGAGRDGRQSCQNCCHACPATRTSPIVLEPSDARTPAPNFTWHFDSYYPGTVEVAFYTEDRVLKWPPGNQVFFIPSMGNRKIRIDCQAGQRICYGAWPRGNANRYWGVGYGGRNGCVNCCYACDGGESITFKLNP